jgi:hypothetical protein
MGSESVLYLWSDSSWEMVADLSEFGVQGITRLAVTNDGDRIAVVSQRVE